MRNIHQTGVEARPFNNPPEPQPVIETVLWVGADELKLSDLVRLVEVTDSYPLSSRVEVLEGRLLVTTGSWRGHGGRG